MEEVIMDAYVDRHEDQEEEEEKKLLVEILICVITVIRSQEIFATAVSWPLQWWM